MSGVSMPVEVFCSYAHEDERWLRKLETHLGLLKQQGLLALWHDRLIVPGTDWARAIDTHLESASIIVLLVSAAFLASNYCSGIELKRALERQEEGSALVIPILVSNINWSETSLMHLQALPTNAKPLSLWLDEEVALADVVAGLRRSIEELPLLAANVPRIALPGFWNIPYPRNPFFLGRETELAVIHQHLHADQATALSQPQLLSGLGGIGKTQLALEYAYRYHQDYQAVLWVRAESREALVSSYVALASLLRLPERDTKEQDMIVQAVKAWLQFHRGWLLILDNADELAILPDFLPPVSGGHLLLTTRAAATGRLAFRLEVEELSPEDGALLLLRRATLLAPDAELSQTLPQEQELALRVSRELGGLPLALDQAGAYLEETGTDLESYWQMYQQRRTDLLQQRGGLVADHPAPVATTWSLSFQKVEEKNQVAADLLCLCAFLSPDAIAEEILTAGAPALGSELASVAVDAFQFNQAMEALRAYSLVRRNPERKTLSIHRLVQAVLQDTLKEKERRLWAERAVLAVNVVFPNAKEGIWPQSEQLLPHAIIAAHFIETEHIYVAEAGQLLYRAAWYLKEHARYQEAEPLYWLALRIQEQIVGLEHLDVTDSLTGLANLYADQKRYTESESLHQRALRIREQQLGLEHPQVAISLNGLANLYVDQGKYPQAEPLHQRALRIREQQLGAEHPQVASSLNNLAGLYREQGKYAEAEPLYQRALALFEQQLGAEHLKVAFTLDNLANLYADQRKYAEAEPLYQRSLLIQENQLGVEHPEVAFPLNNLAELYWEQGKYAEAERLFQRALSILEQQGPEHPDMANSQNGLAEIYRVQGKYAEAEALYRRALHIREQLWGLQHSETAGTIYGLAQLWEAQGKSAEARNWYTRALAIREQIFGVHHPRTTEIRSRLITLLHAMGQHEEAAQLRN